MWWVDAYGAVHLSSFLSEVYSNHVVLLRALLCCLGEHIVPVAASWMALWTLLLCFLSLILLHSSATNWECTLSIPQRTTKTEQHTSSHQQLSLTHPAAPSSVYCENSGENMKLRTFTTKWSINERKVIKNFRATKTPSIQRMGENGLSMPLKGPLGAWMACRWYYRWYYSGLCGNVCNKVV